MRGVDLSVTRAKGGFFSCRWNRKGDRAQPDDLLEDPFGLELGLWGWSEDGPYASEVKGPNGKRGVPLLNFAGWFALTTGVTLAYQRLQITANVAEAPDPEDRGGPGAERAAALLLLSYYLPAAV
jgi:hypothetical protein